MVEPYIVLAVLTAASLSAAEYKLRVSPETTAWGYYWAEAKPVLTIKSGDIVEIQTDEDTDPARLEELGVPPDQITQTMRDMFTKVPKELRRGQQLTGPIFIEGAQPGDVLEVRILKIKMDLPWPIHNHWNFMFKYFQRGSKIIPLDREKMTAHVAPGVHV